MSNAAENPGVLPEWDLSDLYDAMDAPELASDRKAVAATAKAFHGKYAGNIAAITGDELGEAIEEFDSLADRIGRIGSYASLKHASNMIDPEIAQFAQGIREWATDVTTDLLFFTLEINRLEDDEIDALLGSERLARYAPWVRDVRAERPYQLSDDLEKLFHEKRLTGHAAWNRLFDETMADLRFNVDGSQLTSEEVLHLLTNADGEKRKAAAFALAGVFEKNLRTFSLITNTLARDKEIEDTWRGFGDPADSRHLENRVEREVVEALSQSVRDAYPRLSHRYYALKAKWFGVGKLNTWDRNAPLPDVENESIPFEQARETVLAAYGAFSPVMAEIGGRFFDHGWIDAPVRPGKSPGAFAHPTVPSAHPYVLLNYLGSTRDVMTLAHELGHGVHQVLAARQGALLADTPLTLAETASVFGEMLTFQSLLESKAEGEEKRIMIAGKVEDMLNTVIRQIAFYEFERRVHAERRGGELTPDRLCEIWLDVQRESLGEAFEYGEDYRTFWCYIPHFIHSPFYVYAYAFGDCLVNSLYAVYQDADEGFAEKYLTMLEAGGTLRHRELLAPFGLDASDPGFWGRGLGVIEDLIDRIEEMS